MNRGITAWMILAITAIVSVMAVQAMPTPEEVPESFAANKLPLHLENAPYMHNSSSQNASSDSRITELKMGLATANNSVGPVGESILPISIEERPEDSNGDSIEYSEEDDSCTCTPPSTESSEESPEDSNEDSIEYSEEDDPHIFLHSSSESSEESPEDSNKDSIEYSEEDDSYIYLPVALFLSLMHQSPEFDNGKSE